MAIGIRVGVRVGLRAGVAAGMSEDGIANSSTAMANVTQDATSLKYWPSSAAEWTTTLAVAGLVGGNPTHLYNCQDASGNLADAIGSMPLVVGDTPLYQQVFAGWSRRAVAITATTVQNFAVAAGVGPDPSLTSVAYLAYVATTGVPGGNRNVLYGSGSALPFGVDHVVTGAKLALRNGASITNSAGAYTLATAYPLLIPHNLIALSVGMATDQEFLAGTFAVVTDGIKGIGATQASGDNAMKCLGIAIFEGVGAEQFTLAGSRSLLNTLNWGVPW